MKRFAFSVLAFITLTSLPATAQTTYTVKRIVDGDTITVTDGKANLQVRFACVDAPEMGQSPWGAESAAQLRRLLPIGQQVRIRAVGKDRDRTVGEVFVGNRSINLALIEAGAAVVYREYLKNCATNQQQYLMAEQFARLQKLGFWNQESPTMPWDFRRRNSGGRSTIERSQPVQSQFPACVNSDCNCSDFESRAQVDAVFKAFPGDPFGLDRDGDGVPCESIRN